MRLASSLFNVFVHKMPYRYRGKNRKVKAPTMKDLVQMRHDFEREEENMLILRHPYITVEQSHGHMLEAKKNATPIRLKKYEERNAKFNKQITIEDRLNHLNIRNCWD